MNTNLPKFPKSRGWPRPHAVIPRPSYAAVFNPITTFIPCSKWSLLLCLRMPEVNQNYNPNPSYPHWRPSRVSRRLRGLIQTFVSFSHVSKVFRYECVPFREHWAAEHFGFWDFVITNLFCCGRTRSPAFNSLSRIGLDKKQCSVQNRLVSPKVLGGKKVNNSN